MYVVNAMYLWPITLWTYLNYGRPPSVKHGESMHSHTAGSHAHRHHGGSERTTFATITVAVCHCGAGCVVGDVIGEWLVYGTGAAINGGTLWPEYLVGTQPTLACLSFNRVIS